MSPSTREKRLPTLLLVVLLSIVIVGIIFFFYIRLPQRELEFSQSDPCAKFIGDELIFCKARLLAQEGNFEEVRKHCEIITKPELKEECVKLIGK